MKRSSNVQYFLEYAAVGVVAGLVIGFAGSIELGMVFLATGVFFGVLAWRDWRREKHDGDSA